MRGGRVVSLAIVMALLAPAAARADERAEARRHFQRGMELIDSGELEGGIAELEIAYATLPHPDVLYNIARAQLEAGRLEEAIATYELYLESSPADAEEIEATLASLRERLVLEQHEQTPVEPPPVVPIGERAEQADELDRAADALAATAPDDPAIEAQAERLRAIARGLREAPEPPDEPTPPEPTPPEPTPPPPVLPPEPERAAELYEEQVVSATRYAQTPIDAPSSLTIVTAQDVRLSGLTSIPELLRRAPGVEVMTLAPTDTEISIRGLNQRLSNKVLVLVNGRSVYLDFLGATLWYGLPVAVEDIERIEIVRGPASALYGADAFSGVVNIITREPTDHATIAFGGGNGHTARATASVGARNGDVSYRVSGGYDTTDPFALGVAPDRVDVAAFSRADRQRYERVFASGTLAWDLGDGARLDLGTAAASIDMGLFGISRLRQLRIENGFLSQTHAAISIPFGLSVRAYWNHVDADIGADEREEGAIPISAEDVSSHAIDVDADVTRDFSLAIPQTFVIGASYRLKTIDWTFLDEDHTQHHFAVYAQDSLHVSDAFQIVASARVDVHPLLDAPVFSPRGAIVLHPTQKSAVRFSGGAAFRTPSFLESYLDFENPTPIRAVTALGQGNQRLDAERMTSFELGYTSEDIEIATFQAAAYANLVDDQILLASVRPFAIGDFASGEASFRDDIGAYPVGVLQFQNERATYLQLGGEAGVRISPIEGLDLHASYAIHDTSPLHDDDLLEANRRLDQRTSLHKINGGFQLRSSPGIDVAADIHFSSEQRWVEQVTDLRTGVRFEAFDLPAYTLLNARIGYRMLDDRIDLGIVGTNLLGLAHRQHPFGQPIDTRVLLTLRGRL